MQKKQNVKTKPAEDKAPVKSVEGTKAEPMAKKAEPADKLPEDSKDVNKTEDSKVDVNKVAGAKRGPKKGAAKAAPKAKEVSTKVELQCEGYPYIVVSDIEEKVKNKFVEEGHRAGNIKKLEIYVVPKDNKAYYVINDGKFDGKIDLF